MWDLGLNLMKIGRSRTKARSKRTITARRQGPRSECRSVREPNLNHNQVNEMWSWSGGLVKDVA